MTTASGQAHRTPPSRQKARTFWTCPRCGRQFVSANRWHSCESFRIGDHFAGKDPPVRELYDRLFATLNEFGPVTAHALKTRIIFRLTQSADLDADLVALLHEGYMLGCQPLTGR